MKAMPVWESLKPTTRVRRMLPSQSTARVVRSIVQKPGQLAEWRIDFRNARNRLHKKFTPARFEIVLEARWHFGKEQLTRNAKKRH